MGALQFQIPPDIALDRPLVAYVLTNCANGECYVGITAQPLEKRLRAHMGNINTKRSAHFPIYRALRKYGPQGFSVSVVATAPDWKSLCAEEARLIQQLRPAYNCTEGGEGVQGHRHSAKTRTKFSQALKGRPGPRKGERRSPETIEKMRAARLARPMRYWLGKSRSPETNAKISAKKTGTPRSPSENYHKPTAEQCANRRKPVICIETGQVFPSARAAADHFGLHKTSVARVAGHPTHRAAGFRFSYVEPK